MVWRPASRRTPIGTSRRSRRQAVLRAPASAKMRQSRWIFAPVDKAPAPNWQPRARFSAENALFRRFAHRLAHDGAQVVDRGQSPLALDMPEGPAVAGGQALHQCPDLVDRADSGACGEGAIGPHESVM